MVPSFFKLDAIFKPGKLHIVMQDTGPTLGGFYNTILIRYSGEIGIKSYRVRRRLLDRLATNIENQLVRKHVEGCKVIATHARFFIEFTNATDVHVMHEFLHQIPGLLSFSYCITFDLDIDAICDHVSALGERLLRQGGTFAIRVSREGTHPFSSHDIAVRVGNYVSQHFNSLGLKVNLNEPDTTFFIEIRDDSVSVYHEKFAGLGGMPRDVSSPVLGCVGLHERSWTTCSNVFKRGVNLHVILLRDTLPAEEPAMHGAGMDIARFLNQDADIVERMYLLLDLQEENLVPVQVVSLTSELWTFLESIPLSPRSYIVIAFLHVLIPNLINASIASSSAARAGHGPSHVAIVSDYDAAGQVAPAGLRWMHAITDSVAAMLPEGESGLPVLLPSIVEPSPSAKSAGIVQGEFIPACATGTFLEFIKEASSRDKLLAFITPMIEQRCLLFFDLIEHGFVSRERR